MCRIIQQFFTGMRLSQGPRHKPNASERGLRRCEGERPDDARLGSHPLNDRNQQITQEF